MLKGHFFREIDLFDLTISRVFFLHFFKLSCPLCKGNIKDMINGGTIYVSKSGLDVIEILDIANEAKNAKYLDAYVEWLVIALRRSKKDKENSKFIRKIR